MALRSEALRTSSDSIRLDSVGSMLVNPIREEPGAAAIRRLSSGTPLLLMPVRLEARFATDAQLLKIRVYPDDVHQDGLQRALTQAEIDAGLAYWAAIAAAADHQPAAWSRLVAIAGPGNKGLYRAQWVARQTSDGVDPGSPRDPATIDPMTARALPSRWLAVGFAGNREVARAWSADVRRPLVLGPDTGTGTIDPDALFTDPATSWLVDYQQAIAAGMAVDLPLPAGLRSLDLLVVVGVRDAGGVDAGQELADLLEAHRYRWGVELLGQGTPTNTTADVTSAWSSRPDESGQHPVTPETPVAGTDLEVLLAALGLPTATALRGIPGAELREQQVQRDMNTALWATTWGEFLDTLLDVQTGEDGISRPTIRIVHELFVDNVRAGGPLPVVRIGRQPYGLLPATALASWRPDQGERPELDGVAAILRRLRPFWIQVATSSPRVVPADRISGNLPDTTVAGILAQGPWPDPRGYRARSVLGPTFSRTQGMFLDGGTGWGWALGAGLGLSYIPVVADAQILPGQGAVLAVPPVVGPARDGTPPRIAAPEYLRVLAGASPAQLSGGTPAGIGSPAPADLMYQLVRRSLLNAADAAGLVAAKSAAGNGLGGRFSETVLTDVNRVEFSGITETPTASGLLTMQVSELFDMRAAGPALQAVGGSTFGALLSSDFAAAAFADTAVAEIFINDAPAWWRDAREAVGGLAEANLTSENYARVMGGTLSLADNRLDAWITGLATRRLAAQRGAEPAGIHLGGYGWLMDLRPEPRRRVTEAVPGEAGPLWDPLGDGGATLAPSMAHAATAAVLRAAELTHRDAGEQPTVARLDLTSESVRSGRWVLDAVAGGQSAAAVIGYRFERLLHEARLDNYVDVAREHFPLHGGQAKDDAAAGPVEALAPRDVVDGVSLWHSWQERGDLPFVVDPADQQAMRTVFGFLDASVEAVADLLVAEGVHQLVTGHHERAAATLGGIGRGEAVPADPAVARTPRRGIPINARVAILLPAAPVAAVGWNPARLRATVEPRVEGWVAAMLGDPARYRLQVELVAGGSTEIGLETLGLCALDVVCESAMLGVGTSVLEARVRSAAGDAGPLRMTPAAVGDLGWAELLTVAGRLRSTLLAARPLTRRDLLGASTGAEVVGSDGIDELAGRLAPVADALMGLNTDLAGAFPVGSEAPSDLAVLRTLLERASLFGIPGAVLLPGSDVYAAARGVATTVAAAARAAAVVADRAAVVGGGEPHPRTAQARLDALRDLAHACLGPAMVVAPVLAPLPEWSDAVATAGRTPDGSPPDLDDWLLDAAAVRTATDSLVLARLTAGAAGAIGAEGTLVAAQFPPGTDDVWLGGLLARDSDGRPRSPAGPRTTLVGHVTHQVDAAAGLAGLLIDEWTEVLPAPEEVIGVAMNINAAGARPPQSMLLAVAPDPAAATWTLGDVLATVTETLDLARIRTVDRTQLAGLSDYLPAIYVREGLDGVSQLRDLVKLGIRDIDATKAYPHG